MSLDKLEKRLDECPRGKQYALVVGVDDLAKLIAVVKAAQGQAQHHRHMKAMNAGIHKHCGACKDYFRLRNEGEDQEICWNCQLVQALSALEEPL